MDNEYNIYDQYLIGRKQTIGKELFESSINCKKELTKTNETRVIRIIRYAFEYYMGWDADDVANNITEDLLVDLKLEPLVRLRIKFPPELEPKDNMQYLVSLMYPEKFPYSAKDTIEKYYDMVLNGELKRFKKGFFSDDNGTDRLRICFRRMLQNIRPFSSIREMYDFFNSKEGRRVLKRNQLQSSTRDFYEYPIDLLHFSLSESERDDMYYYKLRFKLDMDKRKKLQFKRHLEFRDVSDNEVNTSTE